jgi:hypothetical protein
MNNESEKLHSKQEEGMRTPTGSADSSDTKGNPSQGNRSESNPPKDISKKNPPQSIESQQEGQQQTEEEKQRAS